MKTEAELFENALDTTSVNGKKLREYINENYTSNSVLDKIKAEIKEWYWQADKQALAKDPCVVDAMIDLFIRTIDKYMADSENKD